MNADLEPLALRPGLLHGFLASVRGDRSLGDAPRLSKLAARERRRVITWRGKIRRLNFRVGFAF